MNTPDELLDIQIEEQKAIAFRNRSRRDRWIWAGLLIGLLFSLVLMQIYPETFTRHMLVFTILPCATVGMIAEKFRFRGSDLREARCPICRYDWEITEGKNVSQQDQMPRWDKCPGCGTLMSQGVRNLSRRSSPVIKRK